MPAAAMAETAARFTGMFTGEPESVQQARHAVAAHLSDYPALVDDATLIVSELATNAVLHSRSAGGFFTVRVTISAGYLRVEVEDLGGHWAAGDPDVIRPHGLAIVEALTGMGNWGIEGDETGRVAWARLGIARA